MALKKHWFVRYLRKITRGGLESTGRYYSWYRAFVYKNDDPEVFNRLQLIIPDIAGEIPYEIWAWPMGIYSGQTDKGQIYGTQCLPQIGDMVWVSFEMGDVRAPIWQHGHPGEGERPTAEDFKGPTSFWFISPGGNKVLINDTTNKIYIEHSKGQKFLVDEKAMSLISEKKISLGQEETSAEPAVLGDTAVNLWMEMLGDLGKIGTITTNTGVTSTINTSPGWALFISKWTEKFKTVKSKKVTLD